MSPYGRPKSGDMIAAEPLPRRLLPLGWTARSAKGVT